MIWGHYYPHQPILHVMELTGFKPVWLLGLSHISCGQRCLQKLTMEKLLLRLVLTVTSAISFLSTRSEGQRRKPHTQRDLCRAAERAKFMFSPPFGLEHHQGNYRQSRNSQHFIWPALVLPLVWLGRFRLQDRHWGILGYDRWNAKAEGVTVNSYHFPKPVFSPSAGGGKTNVVCAPAEGTTTSKCPCESQPL